MKVATIAILLSFLAQDSKMPKPSGNSQSSALTMCQVLTATTSWNRKSPEVVVIECTTKSPLLAMRSLRLQSVEKPEQTFWAPFDKNGKATRNKQRLTSGSEKIRLSPALLRWDSANSSLWPSKSFASLGLEGRYMLSVQIELGSGQIVSSDSLEILVK